MYFSSGGYLMAINILGSDLFFVIQMPRTVLFLIARSSILFIH